MPVRRFSLNVRGDDAGPHGVSQCGPFASRGGEEGRVQRVQRAFSVNLRTPSIASVLLEKPESRIGGVRTNLQALKCVGS